MNIQILGSGCAKCTKLYDLVNAVATECGLDYSIEKVEDINVIMDMGVMMTPAFVVDGAIKTTGKIPSVEAIKKVLM